MARNLSLSPESFCVACQRYRPVIAFPRNYVGTTYNTCSDCAALSRRTPLGEIDINAPTLTRRGRQAYTRAVTALRNPAPNPRPRKRTRTARNEGVSREDVAAARQRRREEALIARPVGFLSQFCEEPPPTHDLGPMRLPQHECLHCLAYHWPAERGEGGEYSSCCKRGSVVLEPLRPPPPFLRTLLKAGDALARSFRRDIRAYNSALAFTSVSYQKDTRLNGSTGVTCFQIHGELFHYQGPLEPGSQPPCFAQLYFYDPDYVADLRTARYPCLNRDLLIQLTDMLTGCNPFISVYRTARERLLTQLNTRILLNPQMRLVVESGADRRRENLPICEEVAAVLPDEYVEASRRDIVLAVRNPDRNRPQLHTIDVTHPAYMPLHYVLLFPYGDYGWHFGLTLRNTRNARKRTRLEQRPFYRYRLHTRKHEYSTLFRCGRLFQQYIVDAFVACETTALQWLRTHQQNLRADVYQGVADALLRDDIAPGDIGRRVILPASFTGGDRFMQQLFQDSMAIVRYFGKPTFFITFTANPRWEEITRELLDGQQATDRPDLIARVFHLKVKELLTEIRNGLFGPYAGHVYTIEYQKRGLPHMHLLLFLHTSARFDTPERVNEVVCAELPDPEWDPTGELRELVISQMTHGICGDDNPTAPCMVRKHPAAPPMCQKRFPKEFSAVTVIREDSYPQYQRRDDGRTFRVRKPGTDEEITRDNRYVVPYNPYLLRKYRSHINVEVCATVQAVKYINKYVYKGSDRTTIQVAATNDEIKRYVQGRYIGPIEGFWRLFEFPTHQEWPPVQHLAVHLQGQQPVYFADDLSPSVVALRAEHARSTLMAFFDYNRDHEDGRQLLYSEFPTRYTWHPNTGSWEPRRRGTSIGRMYHCNPVSGERYYLRLLLTSVRGPQSFEDLYTVRSVRHPTYQAACIALGLADNDQEWYHCFDEAVLFTPARGLRTLFLTGLRNQLIAEPAILWERYKDHFCDDLLHRLSNTISSFPLPLLNPQYDYGLYLLGLGLCDMQLTLEDYGLPVNTFNWTACHVTASSRQDQEEYASQAAEMVASLNLEQRQCFDTIITAVRNDPQHAHFYLQGPGGTGKTFLYTTLCYYFRGLGKTVLCVASTGIAALLLPGGRTSHSTFKIPLQLSEASVSSIKKNSEAARLLRNADLIIWDEVPMQHKICFEVVHRLFVDLRSTTDDVLFGGIPVLLGGDFAQILPVIPCGSRADIVTACLQKSFIWPHLRQLRLRTNMRIRNDPQDQEFAHWVGSLPYNSALHGSIQLPESIQSLDSIQDLITDVYPQHVLDCAGQDPEPLCRRAILSTLNTNVTELNSLIFDRLPGRVQVYNAINSADVNEASEGVDELPVEHLQSIDLPSLPPSRLCLKIGTPVMLLRNLCPPEGLCNGSRMVVTGTRQHCLEVRLLGGDFHSELRTLPRIKLSSTDDQLSFTLTRKQFPVRLSFAITINRSQGQSFDIAGIDLRTPVFTHGQFYVAVSRVTSVSGLRVLLPNIPNPTTNNIVYPEVLDSLQS